MSQAQKTVGQVALLQRFDLRRPAPFVTSTVGPGSRSTRIEAGRRVEHYTRAYDPGETVAGHLRFALRYEPLDMGIIVAVMRAVQPAEIRDWVLAEPNGQYARRAWFFYEWATGGQLDLPDAGVVRYVSALSPEFHITAGPRKSPRHKVEDNLLGGPGFCPTVRRSDAIAAALDRGLAARGRAVLHSVAPDVLARAVNYLFTKETRTSFEIEHEVPSQEKAQRFVQSLQMADQLSLDHLQDLIALQGRIVDPRYAATGLRDFQNFVGGTIGFDYTEHVHFICPRPEDIAPLMTGWQEMSRRLVQDLDPVIAAAVIAFGFVFLHPFEDGNGRIHRFLIHKILSDQGFTPQGVLFPVSAAILRDRHGYDRCLEAFSGAIGPHIDWSWGPDKSLRVTNETADLYRYFDATPQVEYLFDRIDNTIEVDLRQELAFIARFDQALQAVRQIIDMPDRRARLLTQLVLQNGGRLSKGKRGQFAELTEDEIAAVEQAIATATS
ncbi:cell filamentation protein Fic [Epibacterium sp. SM1979]|uniref:Cell filamentation protein Fic n=1 Tax=Tritonibacter litoralis TaxID=2662264 RepID=A0A843YK86_9RHOB|nr:Fic family protein [Tritonibacter litoralis]MQQ09633.1 cell filamentation protein Fic [Tritonibacter litoralis]